MSIKKTHKLDIKIYVIYDKLQVILSLWHDICIGCDIYILDNRRQSPKYKSYQSREDFN